jgi:NADH-quinone oxidoreductase subunit G
MSANPESDLITVEINGREYKAQKGQMIIEITDANGIDVPRFCYHKKLSIAANCRMCLVQVEKAPKPLPACATPVMDGMKIYTNSDYARNAQKAVMEFLLINHPLDCPICDQGGECELQDLALGYGRDVSRFTEKKRVVKDKDIGPLIATDMTRCIHCTRCVRFMEEIAGFKELGGTGRGEQMEIGTYVERALESELSGNIIDVCPVGALTSKPFRFRARAWELSQQAGIAPHDCVGSNLFVHSRRGEVMRVVPRENEAINEVWLSDRDRFSYQALTSEDRLRVPMVKEAGVWRETDWEQALQRAAEGLKAVSADQVGVLASPSATLEEHYLLARIGEALGWNHRDHRLRQQDFTGQEGAPLFPTLWQGLEDLEHLDAVLLVGSNPRLDQPLLGHRIRKAAQRGGKVLLVNPVDYAFTFKPAFKSIVQPSRMVQELAAIAKCMGASVPDRLKSLVEKADCGVVQQGMANALREGQRVAVLLGPGAIHHPAFSVLRTLGQALSAQANGILGQMTEGANSAGAWLAGMVPHRLPAGGEKNAPGLDARAMLEQPRKAYVLLGVEPELDCGDGALARSALEAAERVVNLTSFVTDEIRNYADVLLPIAAYTETSGTYVNATGAWQSFPGAVPPPGEARPGWKVLRVLGNLLGLEDFEYLSSDEVRDELRERLAGAQSAGVYAAGPVAELKPAVLERVGDPAMYGLDALVRRAPALQQAPGGGRAQVRVCTEQLSALGLTQATRVQVAQGDAQTVLELVPDERVPMGAAWIPAGLPGSEVLGALYGPIELRAVNQ